MEEFTQRYFRRFAAAQVEFQAAEERLFRRYEREQALTGVPTLLAPVTGHIGSDALMAKVQALFDPLSRLNFGSGVQLPVELSETEWWTPGMEMSDDDPLSEQFGDVAAFEDISSDASESDFAEPGLYQSRASEVSEADFSAARSIVAFPIGDTAASPPAVLYPLSPPAFPQSFEKQEFPAMHVFGGPYKPVPKFTVTKPASNDNWDNAFSYSTPCGRVYLQCNVQSRAYARSIYTGSKKFHQLVFWTDASGALNSPTSRFTAAVVYKKHHGDTVWQKLGFGLDTAGDIDEAELMGVEQALRQAVVEVEERPESNRPSVIRVFTDSQRALRIIRDCSVDPRKSRLFATLSSVVVLSYKLQDLNIEVEFHWVKRNGAIGNILADKHAKLHRLVLDEPRMLRDLRVLQAKRSREIRDRLASLCNQGASVIDPLLEADVMGLGVGVLSSIPVEALLVNEPLPTNEQPPTSSACPEDMQITSNATRSTSKETTETIEKRVTSISVHIDGVPNDHLTVVDTLRQTNIAIPDETDYKSLLPSGEVFIRRRKAAVQYAFSVEDDISTTPTSRQLVFWTDASGPNGQRPHPTGAAAVYKIHETDGIWQEVGFTSENARDINESKLWAIKEALCQARDLLSTSARNEQDVVIKVFSDSQTALKWIRNRRAASVNNWESPTLKSLLNDLARLTWDLESFNMKIEFHWVPRGSVASRIMAERLARKCYHTARILGTGPEEDVDTLAPVKWTTLTDQTFPGTGANRLSEPGDGFMTTDTQALFLAEKVKTRKRKRRVASALQQAKETTPSSLPMSIPKNDSPVSTEASADPPLPLLDLSFFDAFLKVNPWDSFSAQLLGKR